MRPRRFILPRTLRTASFRLAGLYLLFFVASAAVLGVVVFWTARQAVSQQMMLRVETEVSSLEAEYRAGGLPGLLSAVNKRGHGSAALDYLVQAPDGTRLAGEIPSVGSRMGWFDIGVSGSQDEDGTKERLRALAVGLGNGLVLAVGDDMGRMSEVEEAILGAFAWAIGVTALLGALGGVLLSRAFLHRVDAISRTAEAIIGGDFARRVPLRGTGDDLDHLAATLNRMLDRIAALMESLRQVSTDIAHDLRTPLSRLLQRLEGARSHASSVEDYEAAIEAAARETQGILETFAALLRITQVEAGECRANFKDLDLSLVAETVVEAFLPAAEDQGRPMDARIDPGIVVRGDRELLTQLLVNLIENALRHTPTGTRIIVSLSRVAGGKTELSVRDTGPGVPASERARILQRFYRCERSRTTPGNGLGLSLVAAVAELHGADLRITDAMPGLLVSVSFQMRSRP